MWIVIFVQYLYVKCTVFVWIIIACSAFKDVDSIDTHNGIGRLIHNTKDFKMNKKNSWAYATLWFVNSYKVVSHSNQFCLDNY